MSWWRGKQTDLQRGWQTAPPGMRSRGNRPSGRPSTRAAAAAAGSSQTQAGRPFCGNLRWPGEPGSSMDVGCWGEVSWPGTAATAAAAVGSATLAGLAAETVARAGSMESAAAQHYPAGMGAARTWLAKETVAAGTLAAMALHFLVAHVEHAARSSEKSRSRLR